jgi:hypothetical protein
MSQSPTAEKNPKTVPKEQTKKKGLHPDEVITRAREWYKENKGKHLFMVKVPFAKLLELQFQYDRFGKLVTYGKEYKDQRHQTEEDEHADEWDILFLSMKNGIIYRGHFMRYDVLKLAYDIDLYVAGVFSDNQKKYIIGNRLSSENFIMGCEYIYKNDANLVGKLSGNFAIFLAGAKFFVSKMVQRDILEAFRAEIRKIPLTLEIFSMRNMMLYIRLDKRSVQKEILHPIWDRIFHIIVSKKKRDINRIIKELQRIGSVTLDLAEYLEQIINKHLSHLLVEREIMNVVHALCLFKEEFQTNKTEDYISIPRIFSSLQEAFASKYKDKLRNCLFTIK